MSIHRFLVEVEIDDEALAEHDGNEIAPPNEVEDWEGHDLEAAEHAGLIDNIELVEYMHEVEQPDEEG